LFGTFRAKPGWQLVCLPFCNADTNTMAPLVAAIAAHHCQPLPPLWQISDGHISCGLTFDFFIFFDVVTKEKKTSKL